MSTRIVMALMLAGCHATLADAPGDGGVDARANPQLDAHPGTDGPVARVWGAATPILGASDPALDEDDATLSSTQTELYFAIANATKDLYVMKRATPQDPWGPKTALPFNTTTAAEETPRLSPDDLTLYFGRAGDIYVATRPSVAQPWSAATSLASVNTTNYEKWLAVCNGNYFMISRLNGANGQDLYQGQLGNGAGTLVTQLSSASSEISTFLSSDCLTVYFASNREAGNNQIFTATRTSITAPWSTPVIVNDFGPATDNEDPWLSPASDTFVFASVRALATTKDLYISTR